MPVDYLTTVNTRLAFQRQGGDSTKPGVVFLSGFASDMSGTKASFLAECCQRHHISFLRFDYRGCGQSEGQFSDGTIGAWLEDTLAVFDQLTEGPQILVGSSMGGWLAFLTALARPERLKAIVGVAAAPDFTEDLLWSNMSTEEKAVLLQDGAIYGADAPPEHRFPFTRALIEEGRQHLILRKRLPLSCPLRLLQGMKDCEVPASTAERISKHTDQDDVRITLIKNGDHRLSTAGDLALLWQTVAEFL